MVLFDKHGCAFILRAELRLDAGQPLFYPQKNLDEEADDGRQRRADFDQVPDTHLITQVPLVRPQILPFGPSRKIEPFAATLFVVK